MTRHDRPRLVRAARGRALAPPVGLSRSPGTGYRVPALVIRAGPRAGTLMRVCRTSFLLAAVLSGGLLVGQEPAGAPLPPIKDAKQMPARRAFDPDPDDEVRPAQHVVPADLPGEVVTGPVVPAAHTEPAGDLPTPAVTLDIEGGDVSPTGQ